MATNIKFDINHNPEKPTFILAKKSGERLGKLVVTEEKITQSMKDAPNLSCTMNKYLNGQLNNLWDEVKDFRLIWWREENLLFEITVEIDEADETIKSISGVGLAQAELSQINVYGTHINNEDDPNWAEADNDAEREELSSILYNISNNKLSILHRILERAPHYSIKYVDVALKNIQRTFDFDGESIYDALEEIAEEIECLIVVKAEYNTDNILSRNIYVYDLKNSCFNCNARFDTYVDVCPKCGSHSIRNGYGNDTTIFVTSDELGEKIGYSTDTDKVKNCFKLEAGDDDMTAAVRNCNPNGSDYIWHLSSLMREDMSDSLKANLMGYDRLYQRYQTAQPIYLNPTFVDKYNAVIDKYSSYNEDLKPISSSTITYSEEFSVTTPTSEFRFAPDGYEYLSGDYYNVYVNGTEVDHMIEIIGDEYSYRVYITLIDSVGGGSSPDIVEITCTRAAQIIGYPALMETYYNVMDAGYYIQYSMMPTIEHVTKTAEQQKSLLTTANLSPIGVNVSLSSVTQAIADSNALDMAKAVCDSSRFKITINNSSYNSSTHVWSGNFKIENYSSNDDVATSNTVNITFSGDYEQFLKTKIDKVLNKESPDDYSITGLYKMTLADFKNALKLYGLEPLRNIYECGSKACEILQEQGVATPSAGTTYTEIYLPYYNKVQAVADEIGNTGKREEDLYTIIGKYDEKNNVVQNGMQTSIESVINSIHDTLEFKKHIGNSQWAEFCSFIRDDKYTNSNYISSGLKNNAKIFENALKFLEVANQELYKSAELQHSITSTLKNLIYTEKFEPLLDHFEIGNWLRVKVDDNIYKLRLIEYDIDYDNFENISVKFSDVTKVKDGITDVQDILKNASSMASSYGSVKRQAEKGNDTNKFVDTWFEDGLNITNTKIIGGADNQSQTWDDHGMLFKRYDSVTDSYDDTQMKIINSTLAITTDNWETVKTAIGQFYYVDPADGNTKMGYGVNGEVVIGKLILGQQLGIYNSGNTLKFDGNGLSVENNTNRVLIDPSDSQLFKVQKKNGNNWNNVIWMSESGDGNFSGNVTATSLTLGNNATIPYDKISDAPNLNIYIAKDGTVGNTPTDGADGFVVSSAGVLKASNAIIYGTTYSSAGKIGNWNIGSSSSVLAQNGSLYYGTFGSSGSIYLIPSGSTASTTIAGRAGTDWVMTAGANFGVSKSGGMYAVSGKIGEFTLNNGELKHTSGDYSVTLRKVQSDIGYGVFYITDMSSGSAKYPFRVNGDGSMIATNATITGTITGSSGQFTKGFSVNVPYSYTSSGTTYNRRMIMEIGNTGSNRYGFGLYIKDNAETTTYSGISIYNGGVSILGNGSIEGKGVIAGSDGIESSGNIKINTKARGLFLTDKNNTEYAAVYDNGTNLWIGSASGASYHHNGATYISTGWEDSTAGHRSIYISVPNGYPGDSGHISYEALHTGFNISKRIEIEKDNISVTQNSYATVKISIPSESGYTFAGIQSVQIDDGSNEGTNSTKCVVGEFHTSDGMTNVAIRVNNIGSNAAMIKVKVTIIYILSTIYQYGS